MEKLPYDVPSVQRIVEDFNQGLGTPDEDGSVETIPLGSLASLLPSGSSQDPWIRRTTSPCGRCNGYGILTPQGKPHANAADMRDAVRDASRIGFVRAAGTSRGTSTHQAGPIDCPQCGGFGDPTMYKDMLWWDGVEQALGEVGYWLQSEGNMLFAARVRPD